jgi:Ca2+-binding EF-hand superfamily protein
LFEGYDRTKCGGVSHFQFHAVIGRAAPSLTKEEINEIESCYRDVSLVRYLGIVEQVEQQRRDQILSNPEVAASDSGSIIDTNQMIETLKEAYSSRRVDVSTLFQRTVVDGKIPRQSFVRILSQSQRVLSLDEINALAERFDRGDGQIELDTFLGIFKPSKALDDRVDVSETIQKVRSHLVSHRMLLRPQIEKYDRQGTGEILARLVLIGLQRCGIKFESGEYENLQAAYETTPGMIEWKRLCQDVDDESVLSKPTAPDEVTSRASRPLLSPLKHRTVKKLADFAVKTGIRFRPEFLRQDRYKHGYVSEADFSRIISLVGAGLTPQEVRQVFGAYQSTSNWSFDYLSFCRDVEEEMAGERGPILPEHPDLIRAVRRYKAHLVSRRLDLRSIFIRFDPSNTGHVQLENLQAAFMSSGIDLTKTELAALVGAFSDPAIPERFRYRQLDKRAAKETITPGQIRFLLDPLRAAEEQTRQLTTALAEIRQKLAGRRGGLDVLFRGATGATMPRHEFSQRLERAGLIVRRPQLELIYDRYASGEAGDFDWRAFTADCEMTQAT